MLVVDAAMRVPRAPAIILPQLVALRRTVMQHLRLHATYHEFHSEHHQYDKQPCLFDGVKLHNFREQITARPGSPLRWQASATSLSHSAGMHSKLVKTEDRALLPEMPPGRHNKVSTA